MSERTPTTSSRPSATATGPVVLLRNLLTFVAYELRNRNRNVEGKPAAITYIYKEDSRASA